MAELIAVAGTPAANEITDQHSDADADGNRLIRILTDGLIGNLGSGNRLVTDVPRDFLGAFQR